MERSYCWGVPRRPSTSLRRGISGAVAALLAAGAAWAQARDARPAYEAAEIKVDTSGDNGDSSKGTKGQVVMTNMPLKMLIERAYNLKPHQVTGPDWLEKVRFDIKAKYPPDTAPEDRNLMLKTLLEDRLKLAAHRDSKEMPGYALVVAKSGFKLKPVEPGDASRHGTGGKVRIDSFKKTSIDQLAQYLARPLAQTVIDKTGIQGVYDFELKWTPDDLATDLAKGGELDVAPSLFTVIQEQLGLRLQPQKVPVEILIVDHVERVPAEN